MARGHKRAHYFRVASGCGALSMSSSSTDKGLLTPQNCAVIFIDHQPQMLSALSSEERRSLLDGVLVLARAAKIFGVPVILSVIESREFAGELAAHLQ